MFATRVRSRTAGLVSYSSLACFRHHYTFKAGDLVLLKETSDQRSVPLLIENLRPGHWKHTVWGTVQHDDIIGKDVRDAVSAVSSKSRRLKKTFRLQRPSLEEYVRLIPRKVTPIYPADAITIVNELDLHPDADSNAGEHAQLEILEAGTGHGSLTLYLSRAIHAANVHTQASNTASDATEARTQRNAVIHTIEVNEHYSHHAEKVVKGFQHGIYSRNVDFHVGNVSDWLRNELATRGPLPFLSHAILDLPDGGVHVERIAQALRTDGKLVVFNPSITQILEVVSLIKEQKLPLFLDKVIELPLNGAGGGREWDVRFVKPRAHRPTTEGDSAEDIAHRHEESHGSDLGSSSVDPLVSAVDTEASSEENHHSETQFEAGEKLDQRHEETQVDNTKAFVQRLKLVCRPKVGDRISGGGFLGIWSKRG